MAVDGKSAGGVQRGAGLAWSRTIRGLQRGRRNRAWMSLALILGLGVADGLAQSREVLLGTARVGAPAESVADRAASMLDEGIRAVERGDVMFGRRKLESVVARYPETLAASAARGTLQELSRSEGLTAARQEQAPSAGWIPAQSGELSQPSNGGLSTSTGREHPATRSREETSALAAVRLRRLQDERRNQALSERFQNTAADRVFFSELGVDLGARARAALAAQARWLRENADVVAIIEAHADDTGQREQDFLLAERRAAAVKARLIEEGVPAAQIQVRVHGRDQPIAVCSLPECKAQNRRVITRIGSGSDSEAARSRIPSEGSLALTPNHVGGNSPRGR